MRDFIEHTWFSWPLVIVLAFHIGAWIMHQNRWRLPWVQRRAERNAVVQPQPDARVPGQVNAYQVYGFDPGPQPQGGVIAYATSASPPDTEAAARAEALLLSLLTPRQLEQYERYQAFTVCGALTGNRYLIHRGDKHYIYSVVEGALCVLPWPYDKTDYAATMLMHLQSAEGERILLVMASRWGPGNHLWWVSLLLHSMDFMRE